MSYVTANEVADYATKHGSEWPADATQRDAAIARAERYLNSVSWAGRRSGGREQALAWPRSWIVDRDGLPVDGTVIPPEIKEVACIFAIAEAGTPGLLSPTYEANQIVTGETVGPISVQYQVSKSPQAVRPLLLAAMDIMRPFLRTHSRMLYRA